MSQHPDLANLNRTLEGALLTVLTEVEEQIVAEYRDQSYIRRLPGQHDGGMVADIIQFDVLRHIRERLAELLSEPATVG